MRNKEKVLKLKPNAELIITSSIDKDRNRVVKNYEIWYDGKKQCYQSRESWAWAEAYRDLYFQYSQQSL